MTKVFLVDDEIVIREGIRNSFPWETSDYTLVGEAPDGEIAIQMIRDTNPDVLITDIRMPFMDGLALSKAVRSEMPWIGIIILSGYDEFDYARQAIQLGVREYLLKPITAAELRQALDRVTETMRKEREERKNSHVADADDFLREKLIDSLYNDEMTETDAEHVITRLHGMGVNVVAAKYTVVDAAFEPAADGVAALRELAENAGGILYVTGCRTGARILILGDNESDTEERAYAFASSAAKELERCGCRKIRACVGEIVGRPADIVKSLKTARNIRHAMEEDPARPVIVGVRELSEMPSDKKSRSVITEARYYLAQHYTDPNLMLQDVAGAVNMSNSRFSTVFSQETGKTFTEYLTGLRIARAKELLRTTDMKSGAIAYEVGYNDNHYFSYLFKKNTGMTPGEYRDSQ
ncbi:MAG: response regulator [Clostridia bacterium]|nr:response regulator [Clostridia bacterium]